LEGLKTIVLASSENLEGLKTIVDGHFLVFTQPGPIADYSTSLELRNLSRKRLPNCSAFE
jgi:hypothetical protein